MALDPRHAAYLDALGVDVYVRRDLPAPPVTPAVGSGPEASTGEGATLGWDALRQAVAACTRCELHATRIQTVFGVGDVNARWMFIGEAPGADEDRQGEPFVGRAGQLLTSMIKALGLRREDVYIANVLKCRPPGNRDPRPEEARACRDYLERQIELVNPALIVAVGRIAAQNLLATDTPLARLRNRVHALGAKRRPLLVTYHPAYLLRSPGEKRKAWQDLLFARELLGRIERGEEVVS
ncbi:MAG: uracil-DNA glycosylase [Gammaproteobacteria bacterium]|nr:uracil-DNA glycosylase [Gammaproteobacteria bacterium]